MTELDPFEENVVPEQLGRNWDHDVFIECINRAGRVREGFWSPFSALAWISSRDDRFVAAAQLFEAQASDDKSGFKSWWVIGNEAGERFDMTLTMACGPFREALEAGAIEGGIARDLSTGSVVEIEVYKWTDWKAAFIHQGLQLIPGYVDFKWPADAIRAAFPPFEVEEEMQPTASGLSSFSGNQPPTPQQQTAFAFFDLAPQYMRGGSRELNAKDLMEEYERQLGASGRFKGRKPLKRTAFEEMRKRHYDGWRIEGRRWRMSDPMSD